MDEFQNQCVYHLFIDPIGEEMITEILYDFFQEVQARKVSNYPIWFFEGSEHKHDYFVTRLGEILFPLRLNFNPDEHKNTWKVLLMGSHGHSGFSGLF